MEKKIIAFAAENHTTELVEALNTISHDDLTQMIHNRALRSKGDPIAFVRAILIGSPAEDPDSSERRLLVYKQCINILQKNEMNSKVASDLVGLLMLEADSLPPASLAELAGVFVDSIKTRANQGGKALELFPKILSAIATKQSVMYRDGHMTGQDYKNHILNSLCSCKWDSSSVIHLAAMFRDVPLTNDELKFVTEKILRMFKELDFQDLPALVYQLLLLSTKGHKRLVLEGITRYFSEMDKTHITTDEQEFSEDLLGPSSNTVETLRHTEGTIILHISFAVNQDQELGREFIKFLKSTNQSCAPFTFALSLSLARIHRFEDQIFDYLKASILKSFKDCEKQHQSHWLREIVPVSCGIEDFILQTVKNSSYGWDHVVQGLVQLGFLLMDTFGPKAAFGRVDLPPTLQVGPPQRACQLGAKMLLNTFKAHEVVRAEILEQIFNRVVTKATSPVTHYLELLGDTVHAAPQMLLESTTKVREMFDYLSYLSPGSASGLLTAIQPLLKLSMALKDALIVVLRKAMFSRQLDSRKIGVSGFLMILKHFRVLGGLRSSQASQMSSFSSSQIQVDVHIPYNPSSNEALCLEILGNLRRCLTQQADVRLILYQGLYEVLCRNSQLQSAILEMLLSQLKRYYEPEEDVNPPLKLEPCILAQGDQVYLAEPLAHLLCCIQHCLIKSSEFSKKQRDADEDWEECPAQEELEEIMESLTQRMIKSEMEDFELDKSADFSLGNSVGVRNNIFAILVLGTYESLIEYNFVTGKLGENSCQSVLKLFENHRKLSDILKEKVATAAGKKGKGSGKPPHSLLSLGFVVSVLDTLICDMTPSHQDSLAEMRQNLDLMYYILSIAQQKIQQIHDRGDCDGADGTDKTKIFKHICNLTRLLLTYYTENQKPAQTHRGREKLILSQCLEALGGILNIIDLRYTGQIAQLLHSLDKEENDKSNKEGDTALNEKILMYVKRFQRLVMNILSADEDNQNMKDVTSLVNIISLLSKHLSANSNLYEQIHAWLHKLCTDNTFDDLSLCKLLLNTLLTMTQQLRSSPPLLRDLSQDVHSQLGDIDQEVEVEQRTHFAMITNRTAAPTVLMLVLQQCDKELDNTEWVITRVKEDMSAQAQAQEADDTVDLTQREGHEKSICNRLGILVTAFHELVQSAVPMGACNEAMIKVLTRLYGTLTLVVKYYLYLYAQKLGHLSARFEKLVKLSGTHLTQYCYGMITYLQNIESDQLQNAADKGKKKKADKKGDKKKGNTGGQAGKANILKQTRTIPNLIFAIEQYERYLIQLSKKSKVNLMEHIKVSTARDFRIMPKNLPNESSSEDDEDEEEGEEVPGDGEDVTVVDNEQNESGESSGDEDDNQENEAPPNKKQRVEEAEPAKKGKLASAKNRKTVKGGKS